MTALLPDADDSEKKDVAVENEGVEIKIPSVNDDGKVSSEDKDENSSEILHIFKPSEKWRKRNLIISFLIVWLHSLTLCQMLLSGPKSKIYDTGYEEIRIIQAISIILGSWLFLSVIPKKFIEKQSEISRLYYGKFIIPIALSMFVRTLIKPNMMPTTPIGETLTITIEVFLPFFMLAAANIILEHKVPCIKIVPLLILGASFYAYYWNIRPLRVKLEEAVTFACLIALEMVLSKKVMEEKRMHPLQLLIHLGCLFLFLLMLMPVLFYDVFQHSSFGVKVLHFELSQKSVIAYVLYGLISWIQTAVTFSLMSMVTPFKFCIGSFVIHLLSAFLMIPISHYMLGIYDSITYFEQ